MKKIIIFLLSAIAFTAEVYPQAPCHPDDFDELLVSIYEHGKDLDGCEANFENLLKNCTPKHIFNAKVSGSAGADDLSAGKAEYFVTSAKEIELISYAYVEAITDSMLASKYVNLTFAPKTVKALLLVSAAKTGGQEKVERRYSTTVFLSSYEEELSEMRGNAEKDAYIAELEKIKTRLYEELLQGAEVYVVSARKLLCQLKLIATKQV